MSDSAITSAPTVIETVGKGLGRLVMFPVVQVIAVTLSWVAIFVACALLSRGEIDGALLLTFVVMCLRAVPPRTMHRILPFDPLFLVFPAWGMFINAPREDSAAGVLGYRIAGIVLIILAVGWSLFRDYYRFRYPYKKPPQAKVGASAGNGLA